MNTYSQAIAAFQAEDREGADDFVQKLAGIGITGANNLQKAFKHLQLAFGGLKQAYERGIFEPTGSVSRLNLKEAVFNEGPIYRPF